MLTMYVIESDSTLNNYRMKSSVEIVAGETKILRLKLWQVDRNIRFIPDINAVITMTFVASDEEDNVTKTATHPFADDRSIIEFELTDEETSNLISQNLIATITLSGTVTIARLQNGLQKIPLTNGC